MIGLDELNTLLKRTIACLDLGEYDEFHGLVIDKDVTGAIAFLRSVNTDVRDFGSEMYLKVKRQSGEADYFTTVSAGIDRAPAVQEALESWEALDPDRLQATVNKFADEFRERLGEK